MSKSLIIAIIASLVPTLVDAKSSTPRRAKAQPPAQIACTVVGCIPVPAGCVPRAGRTWSGLPSGFDVIVCRPGARPVR
jgi:protein-S-isoprenylcysteine O-methyltransferase Ste14